jgi:predicted permease
MSHSPFGFRFGGSWLRGSAGDMRYVVRTLAASPAFVLVAVLSLAIGIGANVAMFSVIRAVMLQDLPVTRPAELQWVLWSHPKSAQRAINFNSSNDSNYSYPAFQAVRAVAAGRAAMFGFNFVSQLTIASGDQPASIASGMIVSPDYFPTLGLGITLGRPLEPQDDAPTAPRVAVISYGLWQRLFGADVRAIGRTLSVNRVPFAIVGVTARQYHGLSLGGFFPATDVTMPLAAQPIAAPFFAGAQPLLTDLSRHWLHVIVRLPPGTDGDALRRDLVAALRRVDAAAAAGTSTTGDTGVAFAAASRGVDTISRSAQQPLTILAVISGLVLVIGCLNLAGIMLARGVARQRDMAVRRALGASRALLVRQWLLESVLLAAAGGTAGVVAAIWSGPLIVRMLTAGLGPVSLDLSLDRGLLGIALLTTAATAALCGLIPAVRLTRGDSGASLRTRVVGATSPKLTAGRLLIAAQVAISVPLVVGALLFIRTLHNLGAVNLGFDPHGIVTFHINPIRTTLSFPFGEAMAGPEEVARTRGLLEHLEAVPGVTSATIFENTLLSGMTSNTSVTIGGKEISMVMNAVGPRFFETMRIPLVAGRELSIRDDAQAPLVVVINHTAADQYFHGRSPIGESFLVGGRAVQVVGVAADSVYDSVRHRPRPMFYDSYLQRVGGTYYKSVAVRTRVSPAGVVPAIRAAVGEFDRDLPITDVKTQEEQIDDATGKERVFSRLLTLFAIFALVLASIGLHGLTSYAVTRRTNEIGIRLALGAPRAHVLWMMLRQVVVLAAVGLVIGVPAALAAGRYIATLLFDVSPQDPITVMAVSGVLFGTAVTAGWLPARRAARMEALSALRCE